MPFLWEEIHVPGLASVAYISTGVVWLCVPVSLQRPARWTTAAVTARVTTPSQECDAAVPWASLCSRTAKPVKVKAPPQIDPLPVALSVKFELQSAPETTVQSALHPLIPFATFRTRCSKTFILFVLQWSKVTVSASALPSVLGLHILSISLSFHQYSWQSLH